METILATGDLVELETHHMRCRVESFLGGGGQGEVYQVLVLGSGPERRFALKWYFPYMATTGQRALLEDLIIRAAPSPRFLWPRVLAVARERPLLPRHQLQQRLLRPPARKRADLRQRQRRDRWSLLRQRLRHPGIHGSRGHAGRGIAQRRDRPVLAVGAAVPPADGSPPVARPAGAGRIGLGPCSRVPPLRRAAGVHLRPRRSLQRARAGIPRQCTGLLAAVSTVRP